MYFLDLAPLAHLVLAHCSGNLFPLPHKEYSHAETRRSLVFCNTPREAQLDEPQTAARDLRLNEYIALPEADTRAIAVDPQLVCCPLRYRADHRVASMSKLGRESALLIIVMKTVFANDVLLHRFNRLRRILLPSHRLPVQPNARVSRESAR